MILLNEYLGKILEYVRNITVMNSVGRRRGNIREVFDGFPMNISSLTLLNLSGVFNSGNTYNGLKELFHNSRKFIIACGITMK